MTEKLMIRLCDIHAAWTNESRVDVVTTQGVTINIACSSELGANAVIEQMIQQSAHGDWCFMVKAEKIKGKNEISKETTK